MTQELKPHPCPGCRESLRPEFTSKHEIDAELLYYYHEEETDCVFDGFYLWLENVDKWNALPRHNEPQWLPIETYDPLLPAEVLCSWTPIDAKVKPGVVSTRPMGWRPIPNPPEVTT